MCARGYSRLKLKYPLYFLAWWVFRDVGTDVRYIPRHLIDISIGEYLDLKIRVLD